MISIEKAFGLVIKKIRLSKGISQSDFSKMIGIDRVYYSSIENGKHSVSLDKINLIAKGLNISLYNLFKIVEKHRQEK